MTSLQGKVAIVTGAARRVGRAIALALAERGARVVVHFNSSRADADGLCRQINGRQPAAALALGADLTRVAQVERLVRAATKRLGRIDFVVNNASLYEKNVFGRTTERDWDRHLDANLKGPFFLCQAAAPHLERAGGRVVNIADWAARRPYADHIPYCVSKAGLLCLNRALAKAMAPEVRVNAVLPGPVLLPEDYTPRQRDAVRQATLLKRLGSAEDVVAAVLFLLERADFVTGAELTVDGGRLIA